MDKKILHRIERVQAMRDGATTGGEWAAAQSRLTALLKKHKLTETQVNTAAAEPEYRRYRVLGEWERKIFLQCAGAAQDWEGTQIQTYQEPNPTLVGIFLTDTQHRRLADLYRKYKNAWMRDMAFLFQAWLQNQHEILMPATEKDNETFNAWLKSDPAYRAEWERTKKIKAALPTNDDERLLHE